MPPTTLDATATGTIAPSEGGFALLGSALTAKVGLPGISRGAVRQHRRRGKPGCPITLAWALA